MNDLRIDAEFIGRAGLLECPDFSGSCPEKSGHLRFRDLPSGISGKRTLPRLAVRHLGEADACETCRPASRGSGRLRDLPSGISRKLATSAICRPASIYFSFTPSSLQRSEKYFRLSPRRRDAAAPLPPVIRSALSMIAFFAAFSSVSHCPISSCSPGVTRRGNSSHLIYVEVPSAMARSITFSSSRTFPGQS